MSDWGHIIVGGRQVPCAVQVQQWAQHGMTFKGLPKRQQTRAVCVHWTGGENPPERVYRTLVGRGLSVQFCIGSAGEIFQFCDADARCAHAGAANGWSVGIEIVNAAGPKPVPGKTQRALIRETVHGREFTYTAFTPTQVRSTLALVAALCEAYAIPMQVPMELAPVTLDGSVPAHVALPDGISAEAGSGQRLRRVIPRVLTEREQAEFRGVMSHFHVSAQKRDAGIALLQAVAAHEPRHAQGIGGPAE